MSVDFEAAVKAVKELHCYRYTAVEPWARGYQFTGEHCAHDGQHWPCDTIVALTSAGYDNCFCTPQNPVHGCSLHE